MHTLDLTDPSERVLTRVLRRQAEAIPDAPYVLAGERRATFGETNTRANAAAAALAGLGVSPGDTVAVYLGACEEFVYLQYGVNKLGAVWVPTNTDFKGEWLRASLEDSRARVLVADGALVERVAAVSEGLGLEHVVVRGEPQGEVPGAAHHDLGEFLAGEGPEPDVEVGTGDTAAVLWTSGTTGRSKGVMQPHNAWLKSAERGGRTADTREGDVLYSCLPMYNSAAWVSVVYRALVYGIPFGLDPRFSVEEFWDRTRYYGATQVFTLGAMHVFLWQAPERDDDADNPVRVASCIPMPEHLLEPFKARFGIETIYQGYGQSEMLGVFARAEDGTAWKPNTMGRPNDNIEVALLDGDDRPVPVGEVGEISVRPKEPYVIFNGYFGNPEATLAAFRNLWYHTGDLARCDEDGQYFFVDRKADYIRFKGRNVSSMEVERVVASHEGVAQAAAYGVVSEALASEAEIKVDVVRAPGSEVGAEEVARHVNEQAPYFLVPRYVEFVDELPQTPTGRVQKFKLRQRGVTEATWDREAAGFVVER